MQLFSGFWFAPRSLDTRRFCRSRASKSAATTHYFGGNLLPHFVVSSHFDAKKSAADTRTLARRAWPLSRPFSSFSRSTTKVLKAKALMMGGKRHYTCDDPSRSIRVRCCLDRPRVVRCPSTFVAASTICCFTSRSSTHSSKPNIGTSDRAVPCFARHRNRAHAFDASLWSQWLPRGVYCSAWAHRART